MFANLTKRRNLALVVAALIVLGLVAVFLVSQRPAQAPTDGIVPPEATGEPADIERSLLMEVSDEGSLIDDAEGDTSLVEEQAQEEGNVSQSADVTF